MYQQMFMISQVHDIKEASECDQDESEHHHESSNVLNSLRNQSDEMSRILKKSGPVEHLDPQAEAANSRKGPHNRNIEVHRIHLNVDIEQDQEHKDDEV